MRILPDFSFLRARAKGLAEASTTPARPDQQQFRVDTTYLRELKDEARDHIGRVVQRVIARRRKWNLVENDALTRYKTAQTEFAQVVQTRPRRGWFQGWPCLNPAVYTAVAAVFILGELPLNMVVFEYARISRTGALVIAAIIGAGVWWFAHETGKILKKYKRTLKDWLILFAVLLGLFFVLYFLAVLRQHFLVQMERAGSGESILTHAFLLVQLLMFVAATVASYARHEPAPRETMRRNRARYIIANVNRPEDIRALYLESQAWRVATNRRRDVYVSSNLEERPSTDNPPLAFYLADFGEEHVTRTPRQLTDPD